MEFRLLGRVELWPGSQRAELGPAKERRVLAILLLNVGRPVSAESLIDWLWDEEPPRTARGTLHTYINRLRGRLQAATGSELIERRGGGMYILDVPKECIDLYRFEALRDQARALADDGDDANALSRIREALALWRGEPLADLRGTWADGMRTTLIGRRDAAIPLLMELELRRGNHAAVVGELEELVARAPFDERLIRLRMLALYNCGRSADALEVYRTAGHRFHEAGHRVGQELHDLQQRILSRDPSLRQPTGPQRRAVLDAPNNLPREVDTFTGREEEIARLMELLAPDAGPGASRATVVVIHGMPGVGKTALALHLAHRLTERHPDAQLFLDLYAHASGRRSATTMETLDSALRLLRVPPERIPARLEDRIAAWRTHLARRRCVIVFDDATDGQQVRPLLPGSPGSVVLVTSRSRPAGLDGARPVPLDLMPDAEAGALFARKVGSHRPLDGDGLRNVVRLCDGLPLALALAASRLANREAWELSDLISTLSGTDRVSALRDGDRGLALAFDMSYRDLTTPQAAAFRRLGLHPGADFTVASASALAGLSPADAENVIEGLVDRNMIREVSRGRYRYHDLLREYARGLARQRDGKDVLADGLRHLLEHYTAAAAAACRACQPFERHPDVPSAALPGPVATTADQARAWLTSEHDNLVSAVWLGYEHGLAESAALLARVLWPHLDEAGHWTEAIALHRRGVEIWRSAGDRSALADALRALAHAEWRLSTHDEALAHAEEALITFRSIGDSHGQALTLDLLCAIHWRLTDFRTALVHQGAALKLHRRLGDKHGEATSRMYGAITLAELGRYTEARRNFEQALRAFREIGDRKGEKRILNNLGDLTLRQGDPDAALARYQEAVEVSGELTRYEEAILLCNVGAAHARAGRWHDALRNLEQALVVYQETGDRRSETETVLRIGEVYLNSGRPIEALQYFQQARTAAETMADKAITILALRAIGEAHLQREQYPRALEFYKASRDMAHAIKSIHEEARALEGMGSALLKLEGPNQARRHWEQALQIYSDLALQDVSDLRTKIAGLGETTSY